MANILVIEDHENLRRSLGESLKREGYQVESADTLLRAKETLKRAAPDLIVLDWMLPDGQGVDFMMELRKAGNFIPIIVLTARVDLVDVVLGLEMGANDYMTKPFEPRELVARIRVRLREKVLDRGVSEPECLGTFKVGSLEIDKLRHKVSFKGLMVELVKKEFDLLVLFAENPERVFSRDEILNKVWGYEVYPTTRTVDTHVMMLRQKIHENLIETVRSVGYRFILPAS